MSIKKVLIPIVMEQEARPFIDHMELKLVENFFPSNTPFLCYEGMHGSCDVTVITFGHDQVYGTGVDNCGTVPASLATFLALQKHPVDLVINAGTCGGFKRKGLGIGDCVLTTGVAHHDRRIPIPGFEAYGVGKLTTLDPSKMAASLGYKTGVCTTGNSLDNVEKDDEIMLANDASVKDMEAASLAWACAMHKTPYLGVKVVTDIVDGPHPTQDEFLANLSAAAKSLQEALPIVLEYVTEKTPEEL